jgi:hypothetical protein
MIELITIINAFTLGFNIRNLMSRKVEEDKPAIIGNIVDSVKAIKNPFSAEARLEKETAEKFAKSIANIEAYDGTSQGQKKI